MTENWSTIEELCRRHLSGRLSPLALAPLKNAEHERAEVRDFIARTFRLMQIARVKAEDISPSLAWGLGVLVPGFLPGAWGGSVPPFTWEDRHKRIDDYLSSNPYADFGPGTVFLDVGCGFPPQTAIDAARAHPDWQIIGADPCFDDYLLYDESDNYACLDAAGAIRFFQANANNAAALRELYADRAATFARFSELFSQLQPLLPQSTDGASVHVERNGARLIRHPLRRYETAKLKLVQAGIGSALPHAAIIRCFNVLAFFDAKFQNTARNWAATILTPGGILVSGRDGAHTTETCYRIERKEGDRLVPKEFAFSIDNLRSSTILTWFALHDDDPDSLMLAQLAGILRSDETFRSAFDTRYDSLFAEQRLFVRDGEGFLVPAPSQRPPSEWVSAREGILRQLESEGFSSRAAGVLERAGLKAWVNRVGHVGVDLADLHERFSEMKSLRLDGTRSVSSH